MAKKTERVMSREEAREIVAARRRQKSTRGVLPPGPRKPQAGRPVTRKPKVKYKPRFAPCPIPGWVLCELVKFYPVTTISKVYGVHNDDVRDWCAKFNAKPRQPSFWKSKTGMEIRGRTRHLTKELVSSLDGVDSVASAVIMPVVEPSEDQNYIPSGAQDELMRLMRESSTPLCAYALGEMMGFDFGWRTVMAKQLLAPLVKHGLVVKGKAEGQWLAVFVLKGQEGHLNRKEPPERQE